MDRISYGEARLYQGMLIRCESCDDDHACSCGRVAMLDCDGMTSSTHVIAIRCMWAYAVVSSPAQH
jgi:hypothetical protein